MHRVCPWHNVSARTHANTHTHFTHAVALVQAEGIEAPVYILNILLTLTGTMNMSVVSAPLEILN